MGKNSDAKKESSGLSIPLVAEMALKEAVAEALAEHKRSKNPIAVWRQGKVTLVRPEDISVRRDKNRG
jgi:hypothetical protein